MILELNGTKVTIVDKTLGYQGDNLVNTIQITVDKDSTWNYKLDMYKGKSKCFDSVLMTRDGNICTVELTNEILSYGGRYVFQLRGYTDTQTYHSDIFESWVNASIEYQCDCKQADCECDCKLPTEFYQIEDNVTEINNHPPYPGDNGKWMIWDVNKHEYVESTIEASGNGTLVVTFKGSSDSKTADHTIAEIYQAFKDGKNIIGVGYSSDLWVYFVYTLGTINASSAVFTGVSGDYNSSDGTRINVTALRGTVYDSGDRWRGTTYGIASNNFQKVSNLTTSITSSSTDTQYPSAKATYDFVNSSKDVIMVEFTVGETENECTSNYTVGEIVQAIQDGKSVHGLLNGFYLIAAVTTSNPAPTILFYSGVTELDYTHALGVVNTEKLASSKKWTITTNDIYVGKEIYIQSIEDVKYDELKAALANNKICAIYKNAETPTRTLDTWFYYSGKTSDNVLIFDSCINYSQTPNYGVINEIRVQSDNTVQESYITLETTANATRYISSTSTDTQYPSAKATYNYGQSIKTDLSTAIADAKKAGTDAQTNLTTHINNKSNPHGVTKAQVGLGDVDNTSDANKPISTATQNALNEKLDKTAVVDVTASATKGQAADAKSVWDIVGNVKDLIDGI